MAKDNLVEGWKPTLALGFRQSLFEDLTYLRKNGDLVAEEEIFRRFVYNAGLALIPALEKALTGLFRGPENFRPYGRKLGAFKDLVAESAGSQNRAVLIGHFEAGQKP